MPLGHLKWSWVFLLATFHYPYKELCLACFRGPRYTLAQLLVLLQFVELVETVTVATLTAHCECHKRSLCPVSESCRSSCCTSITFLIYFSITIFSYITIIIVIIFRLKITCLHLKSIPLFL